LTCAKIGGIIEAVRTPNSTFDLIKREINIVDVVSNYTSLKKSNGRYYGLCPLHKEDTPSFYVNEELGLFYCFGCMKGGSVIDFLMYAENLDLSEIPEFIEKRYGLKVAQEDSVSVLRKLRILSGKYTDREFLEKFIIERFGLLDETALKNLFYIGKKNMKEFIYEFTKDELDFLRSKGISFYSSEPSFYHRAYLFVKDEHGNEVGISGRTTLNRNPKYLHSKFPTSKFLPLLDIAKKFQKDYVFVTEGIFDALAFIAAGHPAVSLLGTRLSEEKISLLEKNFTEVYFVFDADDAGIRARHMTANLLVKSNKLPDSYFLTPTKDADEMLKEFGKEFVEKLLDTKVRVEEEFINHKAMIAYSSLSTKSEASVKNETIRRVLLELTNYKENPIEYRVLEKLADMTDYPLSGILQYLERVKASSKMKAYKELKSFDIFKFTLIEQRIISTLLKLTSQKREEIFRNYIRKNKSAFNPEAFGIIEAVSSGDLNLEVVKFLAVNKLPAPFQSEDELITSILELANKKSSIEKILKLSKKIVMTKEVEEGNTVKVKESVEDEL
jgi:DNA primase catalytic core